jgi:hypothetical protein
MIRTHPEIRSPGLDFPAASSHNCGAVNATRVIARELRAESRRPVNYWLRVFAAAGIIAVFAGFVLTAQMPPALCSWALRPACMRR